jgi:ubiquinone/menaquinone biosynthesis C-methylase UbiE
LIERFGGDHDPGGMDAEGGGGLVALADENVLPFPDRSMDRIVMVHCLESTAEVRTVLRECWRVLADGGRLIAVVANRPRFTSNARGRGTVALPISSSIYASMITSIQYRSCSV